MILSEARQHHSNLQDSVSKVSDKIETLNLKVSSHSYWKYVLGCSAHFGLHFPQKALILENIFVNNYVHVAWTLLQASSHIPQLQLPNNVERCNMEGDSTPINTVHVERGSNSRTAIKSFQHSFHCLQYHNFSWWCVDWGYMRFRFTSTHIFLVSGNYACLDSAWCEMCRDVTPVHKVGWFFCYHNFQVYSGFSLSYLSVPSKYFERGGGIRSLFELR